MGTIGYRVGSHTPNNLWYGDLDDRDQQRQLGMFILAEDARRVAELLNEAAQLKSQCDALVKRNKALEQYTRILEKRITDASPPPCSSVCPGKDFAGEGLRCNIEHGPGDSHGHKLERVIMWTDVSAQD